MNGSAAPGPPVSVAASESLLDSAVEMTFPASDPVSVDHAFRAADRREHSALLDGPPRSSSTPRAGSPS
jgi:hypothetical protein